MYLVVLKEASLKGLALETFGREWLWVTPRSISSWVTFLDVMEVPRSA